MSFVDGSTVIDANKMNALVSKINELVDKANGSSSGGGSSDGGGSDTPQPESRPNLFVASTQKENVGIRSSDGQETALNGTNSSDFIAIEPSTTYSWFVRHVVAWYDSNKDFISASPSSENTTGRTLVSPSNAAYCRFSYMQTYLQHGEIVMKEGERDWL